MVPSLLAHAPPGPLLVRQWQTAFDAGKVLTPASSLVSGLAFAYAARAHPLPATARLYAAAAVAVTGLLPFTQLAIMPTNHALADKVAEKDGASEAESRALVKKWGNLHTVRVLFPTVALGLGAWAMLAV